MHGETAPLVSIGITTYNRPDTLGQALECIIGQTYQNLEIIISDDCSPGENTQNILRAFEKRDSRIKYIRQTPNLGAVENIDFVLRQATGQYFMWADDDDLWDSRWIEVLLQNMTDDVVVSIGKVVSIDESGNLLRELRDMDFSGTRALRLGRYYLAEEFSGKACVICGLFRTDFVQQIKPLARYDDSEFGVDYLFVFECLQYGNVVSDNSVTLYKRVPASLNDDGGAWKNAVNASLILNRLKYIFAYVSVARNWFDKLVISVLVLIKCIRFFIFNIKKVIYRLFGCSKR